MGVPLSLPSFLNSASDKYLQKTIRFGRPWRLMPAFSDLPPGDITAIVRYLRSWSDQPAPVYPDHAIAGNPETGAGLYADYCAVCHGNDGEGGAGTGVTLSRPRDLPILAPSLANSGFLASASDSMIRQILIDGRNDTPMRSFTAQGLSTEQLDDIVAFVRSFASRPVKPETQSQPVTPVITLKSPYGLDQTVANIKDALPGHNMRMLGVVYSDQGLVPKGTEDKKRVLINTCRFSRLNNALKVDPRFGVLLPCRISVAEKDGEVTMYAMDPRWFSELFNNIALDHILRDIYTTYVEIMEEASF